MEFRLVYRGPLKSGNKPRPEEKHYIRKYLHPQLKELWDHSPLNKHKDLVEINPPLNDKLSFIEQRNSFSFAPLVSEKLYFVCSLHIIMLRPDIPGKLITGGDIDNRLKTLFDALRVPNVNEIPSGEVPSPDETPFFCLLQDDKLITSVHVETDRLLNPQNENDVLLLIHVKLRATQASFGSLSIIT